MTKYGDQVDEPWFHFAVEESDRTARLIRNARRHEIPVEYLIDHEN